MSTRLIHRPARTTRPAAPSEARTIEAPPNLPEGKSGNIAMSLLPVAGVMSSVVMMTVVRNSQFAGLGAIILVVTVIGSVALSSPSAARPSAPAAPSARPTSPIWRTCARSSPARNANGANAPSPHPPPDALYDIVRDPARLGSAAGRRRLPAGPRRHRRNARTRPEVAQQGSSVLTPPDRFMLNEASALMARFRTGTELPLTVPLDRVGNVSVIGPREDCLRVARALLVQTAAPHAPDDVAMALAVPGDRLADWEWAKWLPHLLDTEQFRRPRRRPPYRPVRPPARPADRAELRRARLVRGRGTPRPVRHGTPCP